MQHLARSSFQPVQVGLSSIDQDDFGLAASIEEAAQLARSGAWAEARLACAEVIRVHQASLAQSPQHLTEIVATLATARGFRALSRLIEATRGRRVRIAMAHYGGERAASGGGALITVTDAVLDDPAETQRWAEQLIGCPHDQPSGTQSAREACLA